MEQSSLRRAPLALLGLLAVTIGVTARAPLPDLRAQVTGTSLCIKVDEAKAGYFAGAAGAGAPTTTLTYFAANGTANTKLGGGTVPVSSGTICLSDAATLTAVQGALTNNQTVKVLVQSAGHLNAVGTVTATATPARVRLFAGALSDGKKIGLPDLLKIRSAMIGSPDAATSAVFGSKVKLSDLVEAIRGYGVGTVDIAFSTAPNVATVPPECNDRQLTAHGGTGIKHDEHVAVFALVSNATNWTVGNGNWSDPKIWAKGVPTSSDASCISANNTVTVDTTAATTSTLRIVGTLNFATAANTQLKLDTAVVDPKGTFIMGTADDPIHSGVSAKMLFADAGPIDRTWDPYGFSRGLINHGKFRTYGSPVTQLATMPFPSSATTPTLTLDAAVPADWKVGDRIAITSTYWTQEETRRKILAINGNQITIDPFTSNRNQFAAQKLPTNIPAGYTAPTYKLYVADLERNAIFQSEATDFTRRGHVMFMHNADVQISAAGFYSIGRTDKVNAAVDDTTADASGKITHVGTNPRGRYAVHFHRTGTDGTKTPAIVQDSVIMDSPGWGLVNHDSYVIAKDNVAYNAGVSSFVTEVGSEIGEFNHNLIMHTLISKVGDNTALQDYGRGAGNGIFLVGPGVKIIRNIINNIGNPYGNGIFVYGYKYFDGDDPTQRVMFDAKNLADPSIAKGAPSITPDQVPFLVDGDEVSVVGNAFAEIFNNNSQSVIKNCIFWFGTASLMDAYSAGWTLKDSFIYYINGQAVGRDWPTYRVYDHNYIEGNGTAIVTNPSGTTIIKNNYLKNAKFNIDIDRIDVNQQTPGLRTTTIENNTFASPVPGDPSYSNLYADKHADIFMASDIPYPVNLYDQNQVFSKYLADTTTDQGNVYTRRIWAMLLPDDITVNGQRLWNVDSKADFAWHDTHSTEFEGKTNQQLWDTYGITFGDAIMPKEVETAADDPSIKIMGGKLGPIVPLRKVLLLKIFPEWYKDGSTRINILDGDTGQQIGGTQVLPIKKGWNFWNLKDVTGFARPAMAFSFNVGL